MPTNLKPYVICICETRLKNDLRENVSIFGYTFLHQNSLTNAGGVGIYISNTLQFEEIDLNANLLGTENLWIRIKSSIITQLML